MTDFELSRLLVSLVTLLSFALALGQVFEKMKMPRVIGEIASGLLLGPSVLGALAPDVFRWLFAAFDDQQKMLSVFYWLGLILLMFSAGFKISVSFQKEDRVLILMLIAGGLLVPGMFGYFAAGLFPAHPSADLLAFQLVIAVGAAVTSIPVITKIYIDLKIDTSRFARVTLTSAAIQDLILWTVLSIALAIQQHGAVNGADLTKVIVATIGLSVVILLLAPRLVHFAGKLVIGGAPTESLLGYTLAICLVLVIIASALHVNIVIGALLAGLVIGRFRSEQMINVKAAISAVTLWFFVPIYFAMVGLQLDLSLHLDLSMLALFLVSTSVVKIASVALAIGGKCCTWKEAFDFGLVMNTRGGPGIVLASVAFAASIIGPEMFVALVLSSILTSLLAGAWLRHRISRDAHAFAG
jgi:Kef-type K+ transport system membrane component KefB